MTPPYSEELATKRRASRLLMWLWIGSMVMLFAGLTSAYIVRKGEGNWRAYDLPGILWLSTGLILLSSGALHLGLRSARQNHYSALLGWVTGAATLGIAFLTTQFLGFGKLVAQGVYFVGNPSGSFLYVLMGLHGIHLVAGVIALAFMLIQAARYRIGANNTFTLEQVALFWHALDFLWVYLFLFLLINHL